MKDTSKFADWANEFGRAELARRLNVTWGAVNNWTTGKCRPRPEIAHQIVELSAGKLVLEDIYPKEGANV
jgi:DNA-binding XRE family transcriptional regulator